MTEPVVEPPTVARHQRGYGFVEVTGHITKTSQTKVRMRRPIHMVAHSWGIIDQGWAARWLRLRQKLRRHATSDCSLMPACGPDWVLMPGTRMTSDTLTTIFREILVRGGIPRDEVRYYTSHSMKATFLSWANKCGIKKSIRRTLGGHSKRDDSMAELYGRDELAEPLRQLGHALIWVAGRAFLPDSTRSGRWTKHPREALRALAPGASAADVLTAMVPGNADPNALRTKTAARGMRDLGAVPVLGDGGSDIEEVESDISDAEDHHEARDELEECAAGVEVDKEVVSTPDESRPADAHTKSFAPLYFKVLRHLYKGTRHWSEDGRNIICPTGRSPYYKPENYMEATSHGDPFCESCLKAAARVFCVIDPEHYAHGKDVS